MVELGKLQLAAREKEKKIPLASYIRKSKNRAGVLETKIVSCRECGEEFCSTETCRQFAYDTYERVNVVAAEELTVEGSMEKERHKKKRKKRVSKKTNRLKKKTRTKIGSKATMGVGKSTQKSPTTMHKSEVKASKPPVTASEVKKQFIRSKPSKGRESSKNSKSKKKFENKTGRKTNTKKPLSKIRMSRKVGKKGAKKKSKS